MKKLIVLIAFICSILISCNQHNGNNRIDLTQISKKNISLTSSELYSSVKYIPLETNEDCYLTSRSIFAVDDENILMWDKELYRFSIDGHFLNQIGKTGNGHGEHGNLSSVNYDRKNKIVYAGTYGGIIYKYDINGDYLGQIQITPDDAILLSVRYDDKSQKLFCEARKYNDGQLTVSIITADTDGNIEGSHEIYSDEEHVKMGMMKSGMMRKSSNGVFLMLPFDDRLFSIKEGKVVVPYELYRGNYSPDREMCENWDNADMLYRTKYQIGNIVMTERNIYLNIPTSEGNEYRVVANLDSKNIIYCTLSKSNEEKYIKLDDFSDVTFWPWIAENGDKAIACMDINKFTGEDRQRLKELSGTEFELSDSSNPVVVIATEK